MITGYNTDIEHDGVVYHVQTEDKGTDTPILLSLVYAGGAILASKRAPYDDLIASGFDEATLAERLKRQHSLICAAIHAGRVNDLKQMSGRSHEAVPAVPDPETLNEPAVVTSQTAPIAEPPKADLPSASVPLTVSPSPYTVHDSRRRSAEFDDGLRINLLDEEQEFYGGSSANLRFVITRVARNEEKPLSGATVSVKILGTTFSPVIQTLKTGRDGDVGATLQIPSFTSGRAAILIRATAGDQSAEVRRVIHPGK